MKRNENPVIILVACILLMGGIVGLISNCFTLFYASVAGEYDFTNFEMSRISTIRTFSTAIGMMFAPKLYSSFGFKRVLTACALGVGLSFMSQSLFTALWMWNINACVFGLLIGPVSGLPISVMISNWYKKRTGFYLGIAMASSGIAASLASALFSVTVERFGWRLCYIIFGLVSIIITVPDTIFLCRLKPDEDTETSDSDSDHSTTEEVKEDKGNLFDFLLPYCWRC